jgi:hypothetical protein
MKHESAAALFDVYARALDVLCEAEPLLRALPEGEERERFVDVHSHVITDILSKLRAPLVIEHRDLDTAVAEGPPDTLLDEIDVEASSRLTPEQLQYIDTSLLAECGPGWRKVARVVGQAMRKLEQEFPDLSDSYYAVRIVSLVAEERLVSQGDLNYIRFSEVRLQGHA